MKIRIRKLQFQNVWTASACRRPRLQLRNPSPRGFTLIELMVVIVIIGVLMALLIPALGKARIHAQEARVMTEISGLSSAIAAFKAKYGAEPPSRISIYLNVAGWNSDPTSRGIIRSIWPQFDFSMIMPDPNSPGNTRAAYPAYWSGTLNLNSGECLLFFLGGVMGENSSGPNQVPTGFAKNPLYPFAPTIANANREGPFFEFTDISRIRDIDGNGFNEWYDSLPGQTSPYLYFSSYEGRGYVVSGAANELPSVTTLADVYRTSSTAAAAGLATQGLPAQKSQTFQIISPGYDTNYGFGGVFNPNLPNSGLTDSSGNADKAAYDNLTNFNGGRLNP